MVTKAERQPLEYYLKLKYPVTIIPDVTHRVRRWKRPIRILKKPATSGWNRCMKMATKYPCQEARPKNNTVGNSTFEFLKACTVNSMKWQNGKELA
jgi:hypothetical protein